MMLKFGEEVSDLSMQHLFSHVSLSDAEIKRARDFRMVQSFTRFEHPARCAHCILTRVDLRALITFDVEALRSNGLRGVMQCI